jgi:hypothetical protein
MTTTSYSLLRGSVPNFLKCTISPKLETALFQIRRNARQTRKISLIMGRIRRNARYFLIFPLIIVQNGEFEAIFVIPIAFCVQNSKFGSVKFKNTVKSCKAANLAHRSLLMHLRVASELATSAHRSQLPADLRTRAGDQRPPRPASC